MMSPDWELAYCHFSQQWKELCSVEEVTASSGRACAPRWTVFSPTVSQKLPWDDMIPGFADECNERGEFGRPSPMQMLSWS
jgi:hypothetical protein